MIMGVLFILSWILYLNGVGSVTLLGRIARAIYHVPQ